MLELCGERVAFWSCCGGSGSVSLVVEEVEQAKELDLEIIESSHLDLGAHQS